MSTTTFKTHDMNPLGSIIVKLVATFRIGYVSTKTCEDDKTEIIVMSNLTLINFVIYVLGPMHERTVTKVLVVVQVTTTNSKSFSFFDIFKVRSATG